jgi:hypothetical protein
MMRNMIKSKRSDMSQVSIGLIAIKAFLQGVTTRTVSTKTLLAHLNPQDLLLARDMGWLTTHGGEGPGPSLHVINYREIV